MGLLDGNGDGTITDDELGAYPFDSPAGNPTGQVNNYRIRQPGPAPYTVTTKGKEFDIQDTRTLNKWTVNAGVRTEQWGHYDSFDNELSTLTRVFAHRPTLVYHRKDEGRRK